MRIPGQFHKLNQVRRYLYRLMIRILASPYLIMWYATGWRIEQGIPDFDKYIVLAVPHTSSWDFVFMLAVPLVKGRIPSITIKRELFWWTLSWFLHLMNAVPVDRTQSGNIVQTISAKIADADSIIVAFTLEGTRKKPITGKQDFITLPLPQMFLSFVPI